MNDDTPETSISRAPTIRILIVDDHLIVRLGLATLLKMEPDFRIAGEADDGGTAMSLYRTFRPDIVLLDSRLPSGDGLDVLRRIRTEFPAARVLMLASTVMEEHLIRAIHAGAVGYLCKSANRAELTTAIRRAHNGMIYLSPEMEELMIKLKHRSRISPRELEVLELMRNGLSNRDIAKVLGVSDHTIKSHVKALLVKLESSDRAAAVATGFVKGLLSLNG